MTSGREGRLWFLAGASVVGIWVTLVPAQRLVTRLADRGVFDVVFGVGVAAVFVVMVLHAVRRRPGPVEVAIGLGTVAVYGLALARIAQPAERTHLIEYGVVAVLVHTALLERGRGGAPVDRPALVAFVVASCAGVVDEVLQGLLPTRVFDPRDIVFNIFAAGLAMGASSLLAWGRARRARERS